MPLEEQWGEGKWKWAEQDEISGCLCKETGLKDSLLTATEYRESRKKLTKNPSYRNRFVTQYITYLNTRDKKYVKKKERERRLPGN